MPGHEQADQRLVELPDFVDEPARKERHRREEVLLEDRRALPVRLREAALVPHLRRMDAAR